jgi:hypothetical protein
MQQLRQRVIASYHLGPMDRDETQAYIEHRLHHVDWKDDPQFEGGAFDAVFAVSAGIPRRINTLCNRVLLAAYLAEKHVIQAADVEAVATEIRQELGPGAVGPVSPVADPASAAAGAGMVSGEAVLGIEDRLGRLERTMTATIDLLHQLLHQERKVRDKAAG